MFISMRQLVRSIPFIVSRHVKNFDVHVEPWFSGKAALEAFKREIAKASVYLEYGSGGSTIYASRVVKTLVSVEGDRVFKRAVERALPSCSSAEIFFLRPNIGITREFGWPVIMRDSTTRLERWKRYPRCPWEILHLKGLIPDLILIDGRFRVACALESLLNIDVNTTILVDDYIGRDYSTIEKFADLITTHDKMAEFRKRETFDYVACRAALSQAYAQPI